ncbi:carbonic anhydrase [Sphingobium sp. CR28]|uniref:carbonic anhydrase n=1 Tax=Sphingobium sp. CR28 TaxID=3400272 RepID=UPI003FEE01FB
MRQYKQLLLSNKAWSQEMRDENPEFFTRQLDGQQPDFLWIGCSDSRVSPEQMTMTHPGGIFMHRNIANLVNEKDNNLLSVVQFAVDVLKVSHIIVCGHYGCGGIMAALDEDTAGPIHEWLASPREVCAKHRHELDALSEGDPRIDRAVELNVIEQVERLARTDTVRAAFAAGQELTLHGWVYNLRDGHINPLVERQADSAIKTGSGDLAVQATRAA